MKKFTLISALIILFFSSSLFSSEKILIALQPLGVVNQRLLLQIREGIRAVYHADVVILKGKKLPESAYYPPRKRYRAGKLLDYLKRERGRGLGKIVGITLRDISTTKGKFYDWGIFGLGSVGGRSCVISTFRLKRGRAGKRKFIKRLVKVVNHELGHTFGLGHCPVEGCLMQDAGGTIVTVDRESGAFCKNCRERLGDILHR